MWLEMWGIKFVVWLGVYCLFGFPFLNVLVLGLDLPFCNETSSFIVSFNTIKIFADFNKISYQALTGWVWFF